MGNTSKIEKEKIIKKVFKGNSGITLIALVITIIVLLILAGVTIATLTGDNGLLTKATTAKNKSEEAEIEEQIKLSYTEWQTAKYTGETKNLQKYMEDGLKVTLRDDNLEVTEENEGIYVITTGGRDYTFTVSEGKIDSDIAVTRIKKSTAKEDSYVGCYADIDKDGIVDGVIFADLLTGSVRDTQQWINSDGIYTLPINVTINNVNTYYISQESYTDIHFGTHAVISPKTTNKEKRFYIMQLSDFSTPEYIDEEDETKSYPAYTKYYWYKNAYGKMNPLITSYDFGKGNENTGKMITKWNAAGTSEGYTDADKDSQDIWNHIQTLYDDGKGWFIPSRAEWAAFANELDIQRSNYSSIYGLYGGYMSSSQFDINRACVPAWSYSGRMGLDNVNSAYRFRLATTF